MKMPLHSKLESGVPSATHIVGPLFFEGATTSMHIFNEFVEQLEELTEGYYQLDVATCHLSKQIMYLIRSFFEDHIISKGLWPMQSPDLSFPNFFLWGFPKGCVYCD
ncbi:hypothetical protein X975_22444, partial [Stegodyphus mimosarum]